MSSIQHGMALADSYVAKCDVTVSGGPNGERDSGLARQVSRPSPVTQVLHLTIYGLLVICLLHFKPTSPIKDGDPDIPILKQAKAEYAKLQERFYSRNVRRANKHQNEHQYSRDLISRAFARPLSPYCIC